MARFPITPEGVQVTHFEIEASATDLLSPRPTRLWVEGSGFFTMVDEEGNEVTYNVTVERFFDFSPVQVTAIDTGVRVIGWGKVED